MSGPKRGRIRFSHPRVTYDPTPTRIADLRNSAAKLNAWLSQHSEFLARCLGAEAADEAHACYQTVLDYAEAQLPDEGFDAYGHAWQTFNRLWRRAVEAKQEGQRRARAERRRERTEAKAVIAECREMWADADVKQVLKQWAPEREIRALTRMFADLADCQPYEVLEAAGIWQQRLNECLRSARAQAETNAQRAAEFLPNVRASLSTLMDVDVSGLDDGEKALVEYQVSELRAKVYAAMADQDVPTLQDMAKSLDQLCAELLKKTDGAKTKRAAMSFAEALSELGYSVQLGHKEERGGIVIKASSFPLHSLVATFEPGSDEVALKVNGDHDTRQCIKDVASIQEALSKRGIEFEMMDWGRTNPRVQILERHVQRQTLGEH